MARNKAPFEHEVYSRYGAPMGRSSDKPEDFDLSERLHLRRVRLYDGAYDKGGAYWGMGTPLWCVWDGEGHVYYDRAASPSTIKASFPGARWYR